MPHIDTHLQGGSFSSCHFVFICCFVFFSPRFVTPPSISWHLQTQNGQPKGVISTYIFIHIYIYAVKLLSGPSLPLSGVIIWSKWGLLSGPRLFLGLFCGGFKRIFAHSVIILCVFVQRCPLRDTYLFFENWFAETPGFTVFWGCAVFLGQVVKRGHCWTPPPNKENILTDNWKAHFCIFWLLFLVFMFSPFLFFVLFLVLFFVLFFDLFFCIFDFFWGSKGQVRSPKGPPHLPLNPPYFFGGVVLFSSFFLFWREKACQKRHCLLSFQCLLLFLPSFMFPSPIFTLSFSVSLLLLSVFFSFLLFFRVCFILLPCFCLFVYLFCFFAFVSWKEQQQNITLERFFFNVSVFVLFYFRSFLLVLVLLPDF